MSTPFKIMKAIYVYLAAFVGLLIVAAGFYGFIQYILTILFIGAAFDAVYLINPITYLTTGLFIMIPHWAIGHHFHILEHKATKKK